MAKQTQFAYRTLKGVGIVNADPTYEPLPELEKPEGSFRCSVYSPCGRYYAWASAKEVTVLDASTASTAVKLSIKAVYELAFSPKGSFLMTWERPAKDSEGNATKNLKIWSLAAREAHPVQNGPGGHEAPLGSFVQRSQTGWSLQYSGDERYCARAVTNEVQVYESHELGTVWNKLRVEGVSDFALSGGERPSIATFIPERKGQPAAVKVFRVPEFSAPVSQKTFFKGDKVQLKWNNLGTSLIVLAQTEVDKTGKSYYGETNLYLLSSNGDFDCRVELDKEGPIHDVSWSPSSKRFGVVYGYMPAKTTIFDTRAVAKHSFALGPRNTISFSTHGRFVLVAGFGNLAGQIDIYDGEKDYQKLTTIESGSPSVCEWSPDGAFILTATTSPRLRVDNGVRVWHVSGGLMYNEDLVELYEVAWRPAPADSHHPQQDPLTTTPTPHTSAFAYLGKVKTPSKPAGAYRPPGARGQTTPLHFKREDEGGAAHVSEGVAPSMTGVLNGFGQRRRREVPGAEAASPLPPGAAPGGGVSLTLSNELDEVLSKAAIKNKKKREAKKAKDAAAVAAAAVSTENVDGLVYRDSEPRDRKDHTPNQSRNEQTPRSRSRRDDRDRSATRAGGPRHGGERDEKQQQQQQQQQRQGASTLATARPSSGRNASAVGRPTSTETDTTGTAAPDVTVTTPGGGSPEHKKVRGLLKKLRAIDDLKMRLASGERLEDTQMKKIYTEDAVRKELEEVGWTG